jgi:hypothetical protein
MKAADNIEERETRAMRSVFGRYRVVTTQVFTSKIIDLASFAITFNKSINWLPHLARTGNLRSSLHLTSAALGFHIFTGFYSFGLQTSMDFNHCWQCRLRLPSIREYQELLGPENIL